MAAYPEIHPEASSAAADIGHLAAKVAARTSQVMPQYCYNTDTLLRFAERMRGYAIDVPIAIGVMPIHDIQAIQRLSVRCGAPVPNKIVAQFEKLSDPDDQFQLAVEIALKQIAQLAEHGLDQVHLYTLNRPQWVQRISCGLGEPRLAKSA